MNFWKRLMYLASGKEVRPPRLVWRLTGWLVSEVRATFHPDSHPADLNPLFHLMCLSLHTHRVQTCLPLGGVKKWSDSSASVHKAAFVQSEVSPVPNQGVCSECQSKTILFALQRPGGLPGFVARPNDHLTELLLRFDPDLAARAGSTRGGCNCPSSWYKLQGYCAYERTNVLRVRCGVTAVMSYLRPLDPDAAVRAGKHARRLPSPSQVGGTLGVHPRRMRMV